MRPLARGRTIVPGVRIEEHLHRSRHLDVYAAWCERRAVSVVVKAPRPDRLRDVAIVRDLLREGRLLRRLAHPHLLRAYEVHRAPRPAIVLETVGGETLGHLFARVGRLPAEDLAQLGLQLSSALGYLHREGVVHLDVKPSNAIADAGCAKLIDLSVARAPGRMSAGRGTWCNMAPEQARGGAVGSPADVWGLGTVLWEAATGKNPFDEIDQCEQRAAPVRVLRPHLPRALGDAIDACLEPEATHRPALREIDAALAAA
jgi:eukaryotic-like serine/threonine-protein kinase